MGKIGAFLGAIEAENGGSRLAIFAHLGVEFYRRSSLFFCWCYDIRAGASVISVGRGGSWGGCRGNGVYSRLVRRTSEAASFHLWVGNEPQKDR